MNLDDFSQRHTQAVQVAPRAYEAIGMYRMGSDMHYTDALNRLLILGEAFDSWRQDGTVFCRNWAGCEVPIEVEFDNAWERVDLPYFKLVPTAYQALVNYRDRRGNSDSSAVGELLQMGSALDNGLRCGALYWRFSKRCRGTYRILVSW